MSEFCEIVCFEQFSEGDCEAVATLKWLISSGKAGRFTHFLIEGFPQWLTLCAMEEALVENQQNVGWSFVVGLLPEDDETKGWMEFEDWTLLPYGPLRKKLGSDVGVWHYQDFDELRPQVLARVDAADDSGIYINRQLAIEDRPVG